MNRNEAAAAGLATYSTGKPCRHGHDSPRYTSCGVCVECLRQSRAERQRLHNTMMQARTADNALFAYKLHPDDHAAALAYCQALDLQRGRVPAAQPVASITAAPTQPDQAAILAEIARRRAELFGKAGPQAPDYLPAEFKRHV